MSKVAVLHTGDRLVFPDSATPEVMQATVKKHLAGLAAKEAPPEAPAPERTVAGTIGDIGTATLKGITAVPQAAIGLADIASEGRAGKYVQENVYDLEAKQKELSKGYSPAQQEALKKVEEAKGFGGTLEALYHHPSVALSTLGESIPEMVVMGGIGKAAKAAKLVKSTAAAAGLGEGLVTAGGAAEQTREQAADKLLSGKGAVGAVAAGVGTGLLGVLGSKLTTAMGGTDIETALIGGARRQAIEANGEVAKSPGFFKKMLVSAFGEGVLEEMPQSAQEQMWSNYSTDKPLLEGVPESAAQGLATGAVGGAGISAIQGKDIPAEVPPVVPPTVEVPPVEGEEKPGELTGSPAMRRARDITKRAKAATDEILGGEATAPEVETPEVAFTGPIQEPVKRGEPEQVALLNSWGLNPRQKAYKQLLAEDLSTPEGLAKADVIVQKHEDSTHPGNTFNKTFDRGAFETHAEAVRSKAEAPVEEIPPTVEAPVAEAPVAEALKKEDKDITGIYKDLGRKGIEALLDRPITDNRLSTSDALKAMVDKHADLKKKLVEGDLTVGDIHDKLPPATRDAFLTAIHNTATPKNVHADTPKNVAKELVSENKVKAAVAEKAAPVVHTLEELNTQLEDAYVNEASPVKIAALESKIRKAKQSVAPIKEEAVKEGKPTTAILDEELELPESYSTSTSDKTTGHTAESLLRGAPKELKALVASGKAVIHNNQSTLPKRADGQEHPANVKGMTTPDGVTHYVANKLTPSTLHGVALHEVGVHVGMETMVGPQLWNDFKEQVMSSKDPAFVAAREAVPTSTPEAHVAEEALAYLVENSPNHSLVRRIIAAVRNWARTTFGAKFSLTEADARQMAMSALRREAKTATKAETGKPEMYAHANPTVNTLLDPALRTTTEKDALSRLGAINETIGETKALIPKGVKMFRTSWIASMDGLSKTLKEKPLFEAGKLRADQVMRFTKTLGSLIRAGLEHGIPVLAGDNTIKIKEDGRLALAQIMKRATAFGKANKLDGMAAVNEVARALHGEETIESDKAIHRRAAALRTSARQLRASAKLPGLPPAKIAEKYENAKKLVRLAADLEKVKRERGNVTPERIQAAHEMLKDYPEIGTILKDIRDLNKSLAQLLKDTGLIDQNGLNKYNAPKHYIPMYRSDEITSNEDGGSRWGGTGRGAKSSPQVQRRKGHEYDINLWDNLQKHYGFITASAMQNYTRQTSVEHMQLFGEAQKAKDQALVSKDGNLAVYEDGKKVWYVIDDGNTLLAFQNFQYVLNPIFKAMGKATSIFRAGQLINPIYWYRQLVRDPVLAWITGDVGFVTPFHALYEFAQITTGTSKIGKKLRLRGVVGPVDALHDYNDMQRQIGRALNQPKDIWSKIGDMAMHIHEASDSATRAAVYRSAHKIAKKQGMSDVDADNVATFKARETINFSVHGNSETLNTMRNLIPFLSSTLNGLDVMYRAMSGHNLNAADKKRVMKKFYGRGLMLFTMSFVYAMCMGDDDSYEDVTDSVKDNNWLIPAGPDDEHGRHTFVKVPAPHDVGWVFKTLPELIVRSMNNDVTVKEFLSSFLRGVGQMLPSVTGIQAVKPIIENVANHDFFSGREIEGHFDAGKSVGSRDTGASRVAKFMSNELHLKDINLSPVKIDHLIKGYFAEWGAMGTAVIGAMVEQAEGKNLTPTTSPLKLPMLRGILTDPETSKNTTRFYDLLKAANMIAGDLNDAKRSGDRETAMKIINDPENKKQIAASKPLNNISIELGKLRAQINVIGNRPSSPENIQRIRDIKYRQTQLADRAIKLADRAGLKY